MPEMECIVAKDFLSGIPHEYGMDEGRFVSIRRTEARNSGDLPWIAPGLFDVQINGFGGTDFNNPIDEAGWKKASAALSRHGCTHFLCTLITNSAENYRSLLAGLEKLRQSDASGHCRGYHMEGPFLNPDPGTHGIHQTKWMQAANAQLLEEWERICGNNIRLITLAPEVSPENSLSFIRHAASKGICISLGHSLAKGEIIDEAVRAGARCWTHLGNAIGKVTDKFDNVLLHVLGNRDLLAFVIPDGIHVPPHAFRAMADALGERLLLTTDAMSAAAAPEGAYRVCHTEVFIGKDRIARNHEGRLAGATITPFEGVFRAAEMTGQPWQKSWKAFSIRPAKLLGISHGLEEGQEASFCLLNTDPKSVLKATYLKGKCVFSSEK